MKNRVEILEKAKELFFRVMLARYEGDQTNLIFATDLYGYETVDFSEGDWTMIDHYRPDPKILAGTITLFYMNTPVWFTAYCGENYKEEVFELLKEILVKTYQEKNFHLGRGPASTLWPLGSTYYYTCNADEDDDEANHFHSFSGIEEVFEYGEDENQGVRVGFMKIIGTALI